MLPGRAEPCLRGSMQVHLALLADYANLSIDGKLNIMGIFNRVYARSLPAIHPETRLVLVLKYEPAERGRPHRLEVQLLDPDGRELLGLASSLALSADAPIGADMPQIMR